MDTTGVNEVTVTPRAVERDLNRLRDTVGRVVGSVFYGTMLKTMRESKLKGLYGHGGRGEEVFTAQLHEILAERAGTTTQRGLEDVLLARLEPQQRLVSQLSVQGNEVGS